MKDFDLDKKFKNTGFKIPDNYFEQFEVSMLEQISKTEKTKVVSIFYKKQIWISAIAAVFVALIAIPFYFNGSNNTKNVDTTSLENYLVTQYTPYDLADKLSEENIDALESELALNDEALEHYLIETQNLDYYLNE